MAHSALSISQGSVYRLSPQMLLNVACALDLPPLCGRLSAALSVDLARVASRCVWNHSACLRETEQELQGVWRLYGTELVIMAARPTRPRLLSLPFWKVWRLS